MEDPEFRQRFVREAQAAASLDHPNIATVFELDEEHGFLAMELVPGPSLKDRIRERPLKLKDALRIAGQVGEGLRVAHQHGVVHRDIKSGNILLTPEGQAKITDFGLATLVDRSRVTKTGAALGTPGYMAPEQARGEKVDGRADLWALGVVLYEMLSGRLPFGGDSDAAIVHSILHDEAEPLTAQRAGLPIDVDRIVAKCLAKEPGERYQHIDDLLVDLRRCESREAAAGSTKRAVPKKRKWLVPLALAAMTAVALVFAAPYFFRPEPLDLASYTVTPFATALPNQLWPAWSPNGKSIAYNGTAKGSSRLYVQKLDSTQPQPITEPLPYVADPVLDSGFPLGVL